MDNTLGSDEVEPSERTWFRAHWMAAMSAARCLARIEGQLDGGLTVAHAHDDGTLAALVLRYEIEAGLLDRLAEFLRFDLDDSELPEAPRLMALRGMIAEILEFVRENISQLTRVYRCEPAMLSDAHGKIRKACVLLDSIVDDCIIDDVQRGATDHR